MSATIWHYLENQFDNSTRNSRKRMNILIADHIAKLIARQGEHAAISALTAPTQAVVAAWNTKYAAWRNTGAAYRSASQAMHDLLDALRISPGLGQRSKIDEWETRIAALWAPGSVEYVNFLPAGREPFNSGGRDNIIAEVGNLATRLQAKIAPLTTEAENLQVQVDAITGGGGTPPAELLEALEAANDRRNAVVSLHAKTSAFHAQMNTARSDQQGKEGLVDSASTLVEEQRIITARRMYANLGVLMAHFVLLAGEQAEPQCAAGDFFDLDTLMQSGPDEEPGPEPAPEPPVP